MNKLLILPLAGLMLSGVAGYGQDIKLETDKDKISYIIGRQIGESFRRDEIEVDLDIMAAALREGLEGKESRLSEEEMAQVMTSLQQKMMQKQMEQRQAQGEKNLQLGKSFLAEFRQQEGVKATESGLLYKVEKMGEGAKPGPDDMVLVHYEGRLVDGEVFDSSIASGEPATFPVTGVIPGWSEALQLMPVGSKWQLVIPPALAYGERGAGQAIPPNAVLIFDVELLEIKPQDPQAPVAPQPPEAPEAPENN